MLDRLTGFSTFDIVGVVFVIAFFLFITRARTNHAIKISLSYKYLDRLKTIEDPRMKFGLLRSVHPNVFEEMILSALDLSGHRITRNERYVADGGVDGKAVINGKRYLIQAKRYRHHVSMQDVIEFGALCHKQDTRGLFVHTGRSGAGFKKAAFLSQVDVISGERLLALLEGRHSFH